MWKKIQDSGYFLLFKEDHVYEIFVTDYVSVWTVSYQEEAFIARLRESNIGLELKNDQEFIEKSLCLLSNLDEVKKITITKQDNGKRLLVYLRTSFGFPFCFGSELLKASEDLFFSMVTQPLLKTIVNLRSSQTELRRLLKKKDKEIDEYKSEGGEIVLRHLKTAAFNDLEHMNKFNTYEENFGSTDIPTRLLGISVNPPPPPPVISKTARPKPAPTKPSPPPRRAVEIDDINQIPTWWRRPTWSNYPMRWTGGRRPRHAPPLVISVPTQREQVNVKVGPASTKQEPVNIVKPEPANMIKQETANITKRETVNITKQEPANIIKQEPANIIKQETVSIKAEANSIKQEPVSIKQEQIVIKQEQHTPISEMPTVAITPSVSCKQEIKTEWQSTETNYGNPRKRTKRLNY